MKKDRECVQAMEGVIGCRRKKSKKKQNERKDETRRDSSIVDLILPLQQALTLPPSIRRHDVRLLNSEILRLRRVVGIVSRGVELSFWSRETRLTRSGFDDAFPRLLSRVGLTSGGVGFGDFGDSVGILEKERINEGERKGESGFEFKCLDASFSSFERNETHHRSIPFDR